MDYLQTLRMFMKVAEVGSFAGAADRLQVSNAVATRSVASLEERLDARLFQRTTRNVTLTEAGRLFLERISGIVAEIDAVEGELVAATAAPSGTLRLAVQDSLGAEYLAHLLKEYTHLYPRVVPQVTFTDGAIHLVERRFDAAITSDAYAHPGSVVTRRFARSRLRFVASPSYLARHRAVVQLSDLDDRVMLCHAADGAAQANRADSARAWLESHLPDAACIQANSSDMLRRMALEGMGVALLSEYLVERDIAARRLVPLLTDVPLPQTGLNVAYASRRNLAPSVRTFVDFLVESFEFGTHAGTVQKTAA